jgi:hypothetical protein
MSALFPGSGEEDTGSRTYIGRFCRKAQHRYLGNYRSRIEVNADVPTHLAGLLDFLCYEGYPGHHTEFVLKEQRLYRDRGYLEQSIAPIISPQAVISEGIATLASELNFAPGEEAHWLAGYVYPEAGVEPEVVDLVKLHQATYLLLGVQENAVFLLCEGHSDKEVPHY